MASGATHAHTVKQCCDRNVELHSWLRDEKGKRKVRSALWDSCGS